MPVPVELEIRPARDGDVAEMVGLLRLCLGEGGVPRSEAFWRWKHRESPFGRSPVLVATAGGRIVGLRAFLRWRWRSGDEELAAVRAVDTATHPDWRGRGVFSRLTRQLVDEMEAEGAAFVFNTPNRKSGAGYLQMGWTAIGRLPVRARLLALGRGVADPGRAGGSGEGTTPFPVAAFLARPETPAFLAAVEERRRRDPRLRTAATADYLRWRYAEAPGLGYRALWAGDAAAAAAIVLRSRRRRGLGELAVAEVLVAGEEGIATAGRLLRRLRRAGGGHHAVAVASPGTDEARALRRAGFLRLPGLGPRLFVRPLAPAAADIEPLRSASWRFAAGSFELF